MRLIILGAGKYGREIEDVASQLRKYENIIFLDDNSKAADVAGPCSYFLKYVNPSTEFYVAFGDNQTRIQWRNNIKESGGKLATIVHPTAYVSLKAALGTCVAILPMAVVNSYSVIEDGVIVNTGAIIDHDCVIGEGTHVHVGAIVRADNHIPAGMIIEAGSVIQRETYIISK